MIFATLWFLWPIVLLIHPGRSWRRVLVPLAAGYAFYVLWSRVQSRGQSELSLKLGVEPGMDLGFVDLTPHDLAYYAIAYGRYARRSFLGGSIVVPILLLGASYVLGHPGLRSLPALIGGCVGMALLGAAVWRRSRRAEEANWATIRSGTAS